MSIESMIDKAGISVEIRSASGSTFDAIGSRIETFTTATTATGYIVIRGGYSQSGSGDGVVARRESRTQNAQVYFKGYVDVEYKDRLKFTHPVTSEVVTMEVTAVLHPGMRGSDDELQYTSVSASELLT